MYFSFFNFLTDNKTRMTINNSRPTPHSVSHQPSLQQYPAIRSSVASASISHRRCRTHSTCLAASAKLIWARRWVWDEFISAGWESSSHMLGLLGTWEAYPYFPRGGRRCNPDRGMETLNGVEIGASYLHTHTQVHILNVTHFSSCYLVLWWLLIFCLWDGGASGVSYTAADVAPNLNQRRGGTERRENTRWEKTREMDRMLSSQKSCAARAGAYDFCVFLRGLDSSRLHTLKTHINTQLCKCSVYCEAARTKQRNKTGNIKKKNNEYWNLLLKLKLIHKLKQKL